MRDSTRTYHSAIKLLIIPAIGEAALVSGVPIFYLVDKLTAKSFLLSVAIFICIFLIVFASEWGRRKIKSIEFSNEEMTILRAQNVINPKYTIKLKSISKITRKRFGKKWDIELKDGSKKNLTLYSFYADDQEEIINKISQSTA
jgi:hypothetical protein